MEALLQQFQNFEVSDVKTVTVTVQALTSLREDKILPDSNPELVLMDKNDIQANIFIKRMRKPDSTYPTQR